MDCTSFVKFLHVLGDYRIMEQNTGVQQLRPNLKSNEIERVDREGEYDLSERTGRSCCIIERENAMCV
jgi:hypothetical protein